MHGNLDAVALTGNQIEPLGNSGIIPRTYTVQHQLMGPAKYDFVFTNPTSRGIVIKQLLSGIKNNWIVQKSFKIPSLETRTFTIKLEKEDSYKIKFKSRLYLGRQVVFRVFDQSMDVFND